jgi:hypothetical protein
MKILSLDSSSPVASVAVVSFAHDTDPVVKFRSDTPHARSNSSALFAGLEAAVATCGLPDALCVGTPRNVVAMWSEAHAGLVGQ